MIDIIVGPDGTLTIAHDEFEFGRALSVQLRGDRSVWIDLAEGNGRDLGILTQKTYEAARACHGAQVVGMDGYRPAFQYVCPLTAED